MLRISWSFVCFLVVTATTDAQSTSPEQVSYSRQIAPLLMLKCAGCHGPDPWWTDAYQDGLDLTTFKGLIKGSSRGRVVVPGNSAKSTILERLTSDIPSQRMPFVGKPLSTTQIALIRNWIDQGAVEDHVETPRTSINLENVPLLQNPEPNHSSFPYEDILCHLPVEAYATAIVTDAETGKELMRRGGAAQKVTGEHEDYDLGAATRSGGWVYWSLDRNTVWPKSITTISVRLEIIYNDGPLWGTEFDVQRGRTNGVPATSAFIRNPISISKDKTGVFHYRLDGDADVDIEIVRMTDQHTLVFKDHKADLQAGVKTYPWDLRGQDGEIVPPGEYVARFRSAARNREIPVGDVCLLIRINP